jgi:SAM-dependent methyltransferase
MNAPQPLPGRPPVPADPAQRQPGPTGTPGAAAVAPAIDLLARDEEGRGERGGRKGAGGDTAWQRLHAAATAPYRQAGRFAWHFARGKLGRDPLFRGLLARGDLPAQARVVDIGCGQGLLASLLQACADLQAAGGWPADWPGSPSARSYLGIELMPRDIDRARAALAHLLLAPQWACADMRQAALPPCDLVTIFDVLHYVDHAEQAAVLARVRQALAAGAGTAASAGPGRLLLRVGDQAQARGFAVSQWVDRVVTRVRGHGVPPTWGRPVAGWVALLESLGFGVQPVPMSQGTPFANVLLVADVAR